MANKKKFKDTKFGKILIGTIPSAGGLIGELLPDSGVLGIAKNLITKSNKSEEEKERLLTHHSAAESEYLKDVQDARDNETKRDIDPNSSWLSKNIHEIIALIIVVSWLAITGITIYLYFIGKITIVDIGLILIASGVKDMLMLILGYLYGRTKPQK